MREKETAQPGASPTIILTIYHSIDRIKKNEQGEHVARIWENRAAYRVSVGEPEGKRPFGRPKRRRYDTLKKIFME